MVRLLRQTNKNSVERPSFACLWRGDRLTQNFRERYVNRILRNVISMERLAEGGFLSFASVIASAVACGRVADSFRAGGNRWSSWPGSLRSVRRAGFRRTTVPNHT